MVKEIQSLAEFQQEIKGPGLVVVDFFTTWCGPCKQIAPFIDQLAAKYPEVKFIKVDIEKNEDIAAPLRIQSIPTFHFMVKGALVQEMKGGNPNTLEENVIKYKVDVNPFKGSGNTLSGSSDPNVPALSAREARLKAFGALEGPHMKPAAQPAPQANHTDADDEDEALARALALSMAEDTRSKGPSPSTAITSAAASAKSSATASSAGVSQAQQKQDDADYAAAAAELDLQETGPVEHFQEAPGQKWEEEMVPVPVNEDLLAQLLDMGFPDVRARKSLVHGGSLEGAMNWLAEHQDDADIDQPYMVRKSDTLPKPPLSEEEKARRVAAIKDKVVQRKAERVKQEKAEEIKREKERRERGQKIDETLEERQKLQRKREAEKMKKEKQVRTILRFNGTAFTVAKSTLITVKCSALVPALTYVVCSWGFTQDQERERQRLRAEIAADKERRKANKGVLPSVLGVDGYNPSIIQYDVPSSASTPAAAAAPSAVPAKRVSESVSPSPSASASAAPVASSKPPAKKAATSASTASNASPQTAEQKVDGAIQTLLRYRTGGDGGQALKLLLTFVKNVAENPTELK